MDHSKRIYDLEVKVEIIRKIFNQMKYEYCDKYEQYGNDFRDCDGRCPFCYAKEYGTGCYEDDLYN